MFVHTLQIRRNIPSRRFGGGKSFREKVNELNDVALGVFKMIQEMRSNSGFNQAEPVECQVRRDGKNANFSLSLF